MNFVQKNNKTYTENGNKNEQQPNKKGIGYSSPKQNKDTHWTQNAEHKAKKKPREEMWNFLFEMNNSPE